MVWKPHVTVATVAERNGEFLMVEETVDDFVCFNQPAGHLDEGESLLHAVVRETLEETAWHFEPTHLIGIYRWRNPADGKTWVRACFTGHCLRHEPERQLDDGIIQAHWLTRAALAARAPQLRSPLVLRCIDDYLAGHRYPLTLLQDLGD
jgi:ADP-ribose pyrophosphatase YjhB (NUDIX family)